MSDGRELASYEPRELDALVDELVERAEAWRKGEQATRPVVSVHLASGARLQGLVLGVHHGRLHRTLALQGIPQRGTADLDVTLVPLDRVEALTLHAAQRYADAPPPVVPEITSTLELRRRAKVLGDVLAARVGRPVPLELGAGDPGVLGSLLAGLEAALAKVLADDLGRASLAERVQHIALEVGAAPGVRLREGTLVVASAASPRLAHERLAAELDAVL